MATPGPWSQGRTLKTEQTRHWPKEEWERNEQHEKRFVFANFSARDEGRGRVLVAECQREEDAALIVKLKAAADAEKES